LIADAITPRLDRLRWNSWAKPGAKIPNIQGFKVLKDFRLNPLGKPPPYGRVRKLKSETSDAEVHWEYDRQKGWIRHWRITLIADDETGITPEEVCTFIKRCRYYHFLIVELALDFPSDSFVDCTFVKRHALFGKSRRRRDLERQGEARYRRYSQPTVSHERHTPRRLPWLDLRDYRVRQKIYG
jgi:hypothetical protein